MKKNALTKSAAQSTALVGIMAATVECAKLALASIPNVEVVTLLTALYAYVFGALGIIATVIFVCIEPLIWGFGSWMVSYFIHWPLVAIIFLFLGRMRVKNRFILTGVAVLLTAWFGVLTSLVDVGLFTGYLDNFAFRFSILYMRGIPFYVTQVVCNAILFPLLFPFLAKKLALVKRRK